VFHWFRYCVAGHAQVSPRGRAGGEHLPASCEHAASWNPYCGLFHFPVQRGGAAHAAAHTGPPEATTNTLREMHELFGKSAEALLRAMGAAEEALNRADEAQVRERSDVHEVLPPWECRS
jgi:hypothetical protein